MTPASEFRLTPPTERSSEDVYAEKYQQYVQDNPLHAVADALTDVLQVRGVLKDGEEALLREVLEPEDEAPDLSTAIALFDAEAVSAWLPSDKLERLAETSEYLSGGDSEASKEIRAELVKLREDEQKKAAWIKAQDDARLAEFKQRAEAAQKTAAIEKIRAKGDPISLGLADWLSGDAYRDRNGNYHLGKKSWAGVHQKGPIARWNKEIKRAFKNNDVFHAAAMSALADATSEVTL